MAEGHVIPALVGFGFMLFAVVWTWINYSWFMSAYDTDDWYVRLATFVQMLGVLVLALGTPDVFRSLAAGEHIDNRVAVIGYVIMRLGMLALWVRAAIQDRARRRTPVAYASVLAIAQVGWVALTILWLPPLPTFLAMFALYLVELGGPLLAELRLRGRRGTRTTSRSATAASRSSRSARSSSARPRPSARSSRRWAGRGRRSSSGCSAWDSPARAGGSPSRCHGASTSR